jgi:hypothetical protein
MTGLLLFSYLQGASSRWSISEAHQEDLKEALTLDHDVTFEFFKPLYQREWKNHPLGKDPEPYLEKELFHDVHEFRKAVDNPHSRLLIARSMLHKKLVGLLLCSRHYVNRKEFCEIDLHHDNVLQHHNEWIVIDPKGFIGDADYEIATMLYNPLPQLLEHPEASTIIAARIALCAQELTSSIEKIAAWGYVQAMLAACWAIEDNGDPAYFLKSAECLLSYLPTYV